LQEQSSLGPEELFIGQGTGSGSTGKCAPEIRKSGFTGYSF